MGMDVGISGKAAYAIIIDKTKDIIILNHKQLEASIKACGLDSGVIIELSDDNDNDNDNDNDDDNGDDNDNDDDDDDDNSIDSKK